MERTTCDDRDFGPIVRDCRENFDFTLAFEDTILSIIPSVLVLVLAAGRIFYLQKRPRLVSAKKLQLIKVVSLIFYAAMQTALTGLWAVRPSLRSWLSLVACSLSLLNAFIFCILSYLEHARNIRPSTILIVYLLFSTTFDVARCRTLWLVAPNSLLTHLFTTTVVFKALLVVLESCEKAKFLPLSLSDRRPEETSSILNRAIFYWLNGLMLRGSRHILLLDELYELRDKMTAEQLGVYYLSHWRQVDQRSKHAALVALIRTLKWPLLAAIFPRAILLALTICQPLLLHKLLTYLSETEEMTSMNTGYGIIAAYALVYTGSAVATGFYWYKQYQFLTMVRVCLVSAISWKTTCLDILAVSDPKAAVTLMSTDVERVTEGLRSLHDFWASIIQISISLYLLQQQMGSACIVPIMLAIICGASTAWTSRLANKRQVKWMESVQDRIGVTSALLSSMKGAKMRGLVNVLTKTIQDARQREVEHANRWRSLMLINVGLSFIPEYLSPTSTFTLYVLRARASGEIFDVSRAFTTLSLLTIMTQPLNDLLQSVPGLMGAAGCLTRIGQFLSSAEHKDFRDINTCYRKSAEHESSLQILKDGSEAIELETHHKEPASNRPSSEQSVLRIRQGYFGWTKEKDILSEINLTIPLGALTCVIGPVASGKSTLCHTLLGETHVSKGQVELLVPSREIAFCHQTAYLINGTIKQNVIGFSKPDESWYNTVLQACALLEDVYSMPKQHETAVGSGGVNLSGGQRHKVALARAIYARKAILILDDVFSGFDAGSEQHIFNQIMGPDGLARKHNMTVIFATHAVKFLPYADHIVALGVDGRVEQEGSYKTLRMMPGYIQNLEIKARLGEQRVSGKEAWAEVESVRAADETAKQDLSRQVGDFAIYRYYLGLAGLMSTVLMLFYVTATAAFFNLSTFWLKLWTDASSEPKQPDHYKYVGVYALFQCLALFFDLLLIYQLFIAFATKIGLELHSRLLRTVTAATLFFFSTTDIGSITNRFSQDMQLIDSQLPLGLVNLTFSVFVAIGQAILILISSPWVGLTLPMILALFYAVQKFYLRTSRQLRFLDLEAKSPLYSNFLETLNGLATIRAFGWAELNLAHNHNLLNFSQKPVYLLYMIQRWLTFVLDMIVAALAVIIAALAILRKSNSGFAGIALTQVLLINLTLRSVIISWTEVETCIGSVSRGKNFSETTASEHKSQETSKPAVDWPHRGNVEFKAVTAAYQTAPDEPVLRNIDLIIRPGEKIGVCGRSGSGKSSLVLALLRMIEIQSGSISIDNLDLQYLQRDVIRERMNVIPQDSLLLPSTVRTNLDPFNNAASSAMIKALENIKLWPLFESMGGLDAEMRSELLSHGQRQLFSLAAAIIRKSKIVVLDEATSNVDHETDKLMQHIIRQEFRECTIIAVAHRLETIIDFDRIIVLDHGIVVELDSPQALLSRNSEFKSMWGERGSRASTSEDAQQTG